MKMNIEGHTVEMDFTRACGCLSIDGGEWQSVPPYWHTIDYRYSHGGKIYRKACEAYWNEYDERERLSAEITDEALDRVYCAHN